jgi:hypothetical protein
MKLKLQAGRTKLYQRKVSFLIVTCQGELLNKPFQYETQRT